MQHAKPSTQELFLKLGKTPHSRSARADRLFRRLREGEDLAVKSNIQNIQPSAAERKPAEQ